ncbi:hypothetical protein SXCC_03287 [Gluconacetobacter sp. SXCC-1]|nr:hypothetical protein SXCC_03287 [Gluconacetobacter sp. SXCC-1]
MAANVMDVPPQRFITGRGRVAGGAGHVNHPVVAQMGISIDVAPKRQYKAPLGASASCGAR